LVPIRAFSKAPLGVIQKFTTLFTEAVAITVMVGGAIITNHLDHGQAFTGQAFFD
jgi:hypothetical protein